MNGTNEARERAVTPADEATRRAFDEAARGAEEAARSQAADEAAQHLTAGEPGGAERRFVARERSVPARLLFRERIYAGALALARPMLPLAGRVSGKLGRGLVARQGTIGRLWSWAREARDPTRPLVWLHAPSVGEGLMAQAIMAVLRERAPELQLAFTHFSPSAERLATRIGADVADYLPWDLPGDCRRALDALRPDVIAFVRTEAWPVLAVKAQRRGIPLALVNAVLAADSSRLRRSSRFLLGPTYRRLDLVGAVAADDAARFGILGVPPERVLVTGDARFDQVWWRVQALRRDQPLLQRFKDPGVTTVVAGSTWGVDEDRLIPAFMNAAEVGGRWRLIIAPHEPDEHHLRPLEARLNSLGLEQARLGALEADPDRPLPPVVVVDRVGVLADLYAIAQIAYVGGGFHAAGLHSVAEPAALSVPVLFGPRHGNSREAGELEDCGGGFEVSDTSEMESCLAELGGNPHNERRQKAAAAAHDYVRSRLGGAAGNAEVLLELLGSVRPTQREVPIAS